MQTASIYLKLNDKNTVPIDGVTPAEALMLGLDHFKAAKEYPVTQIKIVQEVTVDEVVAEHPETGERSVKYSPRTVAAECRRLRNKYGKVRFKAAFGDGIRPALPESFAEAEELVTGKVTDQDSAAESENHEGALFGSRAEAEAIIAQEAANRAEELKNKDE